LAVCALVLAAGPALAAQNHTFSTSFGSSGTGAGQLALQAPKIGANDFPPVPGSGVAVSAQTGDVYVADSGNHRVDVFDANGAFLYAFGWEVNASAPEAKLQTCTALTGCQAGTAGTAPGQPGRPTFLSIDNAPASPSYGDLYVASGTGVQGGDETQVFNVVNATGGTFTLSFEGETTAPIPYNATSREVEVALGRLPAIGFGNAFVNGNTVLFFRALAETDVPQLVANASGLEGAGAAVEVTTRNDGVPFAPEIITKYGPEGSLVGGWGSSGQLEETPTQAAGTGTLAEGSAIGTGKITAGSTTITNVSTESGEFKVGQGIEGEFVGFDNHITGVGAGTLTLAKPAEGTRTAVLTTNTRFITNLNTESGAFRGGQTISGPGIANGTRIEIVEPGYLVLRRPASTGGSGVSISARTQFGPARGIAVADGAGQLSIVSQAHQILRFAEDGSFGAEVSDSGDGLRSGGLSVESADNYYGVGGFGEVRKVSSAGGPLGTLYLPGLSQRIGAIALAPSSEDLYLNGDSALIDISHQCEPAPSGCSPAQEFGSGHLSEPAGLALNSSGTLYVADVGTGQIAVFQVSLEADIEPATEVKGRSAVLHGMIDPKGESVTFCRFQHGPSKSYGENLPCLNESGEEVGTEAKPITALTHLHAPLENLEAGVTYHYRLRARNSATEEIHSEDEEVETLVLPRIENAEATEITASSATLKAKINPQGPAVLECLIEWGTSSSYGTTVPCQPAALPAGAEPKSVSAHLEGLSSRNTYHWRVVAEDENGTSRSPDHTFVYLPGPPSEEVSQDCENEELREANGSTALPDCRAYEQVTPPQKNGALFQTFEAIPFTVQYAISADGSRLLAPAFQCFGGAQSCNALRGEQGATTYEMFRGNTGWAATPLTPPASQFPGVRLDRASTETGAELFTLPVPAPPARENQEWLYIRHMDGSLEAIGPVEPGAGTINRNIKLALATADFSHVIYESLHPLWPFDATDPKSTNPSSLYEYAGPADHPFLVAVTGGQGSDQLIGICGAFISEGGVIPPERLSEDGRTVFFEVAKCSTGTGVNEHVETAAHTLYARIDGEGSQARTVKISAPAPEPSCDAVCQHQPQEAARFIGSSTNGSLVYFLSTGQLTNDASQDSPNDHASGGACSNTVGPGGCNLYLYRDPQEQPLSGDHLTAVSAGDTSGNGPQVQGVMGISQDGRRIYFVAEGLLAGVNPEGMEPVENADNLYVYDASDETTHFIATLPGGPANRNNREIEPYQWQERNTITANVTPDGRYLLFTSRAGLTPDASRAEGPEQVYRYDAQGQRLVRISIGQRGFNDNGNAGNASASIARASQAASAVSAAGRPPADPSISADGHRAFFESPVALTPGALNEATINGAGGLAENIYEWEEEGTGGCQEAAGCIYLISDGRDKSETASTSGVVLIGADQSGENLFFASADQLVPGDGDTERDIYDARVLGGFAPPRRAVPCETSEACHSGGSTEAQLTQPATNTFQGPEEGSAHPEKPKKHHKHRKRHKKHRKRSASRVPIRTHGGGK
jgi:hypothetical protein